MNIFVTGANGFLGNSLLQHLQKDHCVKGSVRRLYDQNNNANLVEMDLREPVAQNIFQGQDVIIHCAHDFSPQSYEINLHGTKKLFYLAKEAGVKKQIFISSYSALAGAVSVYGKTKYALESFFLDNMETVIRPGLVIGNGGMFGKTASSALASPIIPLIDGGHDLIPVLAIADFNVAVERILSSELREYNLFNPKLVSMRQLLEELLKKSTRKSIFVNIPSPFAIFALDTLKTLGLKLATGSDSIKGLKMNSTAPFVSNLSLLVQHPQELGIMVGAALP